MTTAFDLFLRGCLFACSLGGVMVPVTAIAHESGETLKTAAECKALKPPLRGHCTECVSRARKSHFHPSAAEGERCMAADDAGAATKK